MAELIAALVSIGCTLIFVFYIVPAARYKATNGKLYYGRFSLVIAGVSLLLTLFVIFISSHAHPSRKGLGDAIAVVFLVLFMGGGGLVVFVDYLTTRGTFDTDRIEFTTLWSGKKTEKWNDLVSATFNDFMGYYILTFRSGNKIRLSKLLNGYDGVLEKLESLGYEFDD